jgi:hypothetical protein
MNRFYTLSAISLTFLANLLLQETSLAHEFAISEPQFASIQNLECRKINNNYTTVAIYNKNNITSSTRLIIWKTREFSSSGYTPQRRCREVTGKLKKIITKNSASLNGLLLSTGRVDRYRVLCQGDRTHLGCSEDRFLFHISGINRQNPHRLISQLLNFSVTGSTSPIIE